MKSAEQIRRDLAHAGGSTQFVRWSSLFPRHVLTDGAFILAESAECFWLMDSIAAHQRKLAAQDFQTWTLTVHPDGSAQLRCEDGNDGVLLTENIPATDFPLPEGIRLFACRNELGGVTIMLPDEY